MGSRGKAPVRGLGTKSPEAEKFVLNLIFLHFPELNAAITVILSLMSITTLIKFEVTLLTRHV